MPKKAKKLSKKSSKKSLPKKSKSKSAVVTPKKIQFHHVIILDKSGSMSAIRDSTINGFNETVSNIRQLASKDSNQTHSVTLVTFSNENENVFWRENISVLKDFEKKDYIPGGLTALCDAMGRTMFRMQEELLADNKDNDDVINVVLTVITDGEENSSRQYKAHDISKMNEDLKNNSRIIWTITYIGANQDVMEVAKKYNISVSNIASYSATDVGTNAAFHGLSASRGFHVDRMTKSVNSGDPAAAAASADISNTFFSKDGPADFTKTDSKIP